MITLVNINMNKKCSDELLRFTQRYVDLWETTFNHAPQSTELYGIPSPCIIDTKDLAVLWLPLSSNTHTLDIVEEVINIKIHPDAHLFYGTQYAGDMRAMLGDLSLSLVQVWNEDDFSRLEKNLIAHLMMQKKLKRNPSIFIGSTDDDTQIISIDNITGNIVIEKLIENEVIVIAKSLDEFLTEIKPVAQ